MGEYCTRGRWFKAWTCDGEMSLTSYAEQGQTPHGFKHRLRQHLLKEQAWSKGTVVFDESGESAMVTYDKPKA